MTLSDNRVMKLLKKSFVCGWKNIARETAYAGTSNTHLPTYKAVTVTNCAGHHNVQMFFLTSDGKVLHCLPGFWNPKHFLHEAGLAVKLGHLYFRRGISPLTRNARYLDLHLEHALAHDPELRSASRHQGFDAKNLQKRDQTDFRRSEGFITSGLKTPDQVMHERMAELAFVPIGKFDIAAYIDMGRKKYKYDYGIEKKGKT